ncbi:MAG: hypothetical protein JRH15_12475 [Deltaproteobacteria bacterium]|nr:hypothetical protein [Deltaproteobacteria bacterium]
MRKTTWVILFSIMGMMGMIGCAYESLRYRTVTDGVDHKEYMVLGRVTDSMEQPVGNCKVFLGRKKGDMDPTLVGMTDYAGNYHLKFELAGDTKFWLHFDARDQGYPIRYEYISKKLASKLFQYTGNNPVIVNVIMNKAIGADPSSESAIKE